MSKILSTGSFHLCVLSVILGGSKKGWEEETGERRTLKSYLTANLLNLNERGD